MSNPTKVKFNLHLEFIEADSQRSYEEIVLYNNYYYFKKMDHIRMHHLLSPILTQQHREKMLHYIRIFWNPSLNSLTRELESSQSSSGF